MDTNVIRATRVRFYLRNLLERGVAAEAVLAGSGINLANLQDQAYPIDLTQLYKIIANVAKLWPEPGAGLKLGAALNIGDLGILGHALMSCGTLADALPLWNSNNELVGTPILNQHRFEGDTWIIDFTEAMALGDLRVLCMEEHLANTQALNQLLLNAPMRIREIHLSYPEPSYADLYRSAFHCPVQFSQKRDWAAFDADQLNSKVIMADSETYALCLEHCRNILAKLSKTGSLASQIRNELVSCRGEIPRIEDIANRLGHSERTLRRMLQAENETYTSIVNKYRLDMAMEYLKNTTLEHKQISYVLGFDNVSSFRRAFKEWTGATVGAFQAGLKQSDPAEVAGALEAE